MNKEDLIALSDLNREDNIKYISSEAQGIAIALNSDKYAPTLCKLERAYICGRRKSEEKIAELEQKVEIERSSRIALVNKIAELEKENANLTERLLKVENAYKRKFEAEWHLNDLYQKLRTDFANAEKCSREYFTRYITRAEQLTKAEEILNEFMRISKASDENFEHDYSELIGKAEQFLQDVEKC